MKSIGLAALLLVSFCFTSAQTKKERCNDVCCRKKNTTVRPNTKPLVCKLTVPELQQRKSQIIGSFKSKIKGKQELENGYQYTFDCNDAMIDEIMIFVKAERQCCDFFTFNILVEDSLIKLSITGPKGAKEFIETELNI